jgi:hypothetical protein
MYTRCLERDNETINISEYGFELYNGNRLVRTGLVEDLEATIALLKEEGFIEVE